MNKPNCTTHFYACDCREREFQEKISELEKLNKFLLDENEKLMKDRKELRESNETLREAVSVIEFYGDPKSWGELELDTDEHWDDYEKLNPERPMMSTGGKRARQFLEKHKSGVRE